MPHRSPKRRAPDYLRDERRLFSLPSHGRLKIGVGYPNSYYVAHSSLAYQWVVELTARTSETAVFRFFTDPRPGRTLENDLPLGSLDLLAWSCSFELDAVHVLETLDAAGIPRRRHKRNVRHPLIVVGGAVAAINPLPLAAAVDIFVVGAAERLWPALLECVREIPDRDALLTELASRDGYFVPGRHLDERGRPLRRIRRLEKRDREMADEGMVPSSHLVTPNTEYRNRGLVEMSRGCPEKCRYCWVSYNYGRLRCYSKEAILHRVRSLTRITDRIGFVATAVGDHPDLPEILSESRRLGLDVALSSLRIPAMIPSILQPLAESGARSVTIAPETGSDRLRRSLGKPIANDRILAAVEHAQRCGITDLKMYFIIGLPGETDDDLESIGDLLEAARGVMLDHARRRGRMGILHAGCSVLVPKPYTPFSREAFLPRPEYRRRLALLERRIRGLDNVKFDRPSYREALWQTVLSRGGASTYELLDQLADHGHLGRLLTEHRDGAVAAAAAEAEDAPVWRFIASAPTVTSSV
ncbi:MAG: radical SAM protein [Thermoanaerobaculales bacterium]|jgi:radical SAM superfamily enzyme YgiQ (UPF0313 family)|nr:radical SAM protein [Thermoanaerobaculales bacterium]